MRTIDTLECSAIAGGDDAGLKDTAAALADFGAAAGLAGAEPVAVACGVAALTIAVYEAF